MVTRSTGPSAELEVILQEPLVRRSAQGVRDLRPVLDRLRQRATAHPLEQRLKRDRVHVQEVLDRVQSLAGTEVLVRDLEAGPAVGEPVQIALVLVRQPEHGERLTRIDRDGRVAVVAVGRLRDPRRGQEPARCEQRQQVQPAEAHDPHLVALEDAEGLGVCPDRVERQLEPDRALAERRGELRHIVDRVVDWRRDERLIQRPFVVSEELAEAADLRVGVEQRDEVRRPGAAQADDREGEARTVRAGHELVRESSSSQLASAYPKRNRKSTSSRSTRGSTSKPPSTPAASRSARFRARATPRPVARAHDSICCQASLPGPNISRNSSEALCGASSGGSGAPAMGIPASTPAVAAAWPASRAAISRPCLPGPARYSAIAAASAPGSPAARSREAGSSGSATASPFRRSNRRSENPSEITRRELPS